MANSNKKRDEKVLISSNYLSGSEITSALQEIDINTELISDEEETRSDLHPLLMAALITVTAASSINITQKFIIPMIRILRDKYKGTKPEGLIIIEFPSVRVKFRFDLSPEDFERQTEKIKDLLGNPKIFITKHEDE
ncbi:hypothetical protein GWK08_05535 [Leptobacterium flavescens]|uniref:Uncharacterized protein n=1 Tax=Leptobacterium flavescens TaxID=472055 RepID=A0A6P0UHR9_9FLAO|nr:hypothetical protein [Leptobacterium flavescens]NER12891.1 hypothetical protein [Leptobacterium flavescens]